MGTLAAAPVLPSKLKQSSLFLYRRGLKRKNLAIVPVARLFVPAIFDSSKLKVLVLPGGEEKHPGKLPMLPRVYTFTHSDITSKLTLAISQTINYSQFQGWYNRLQRDEVVAEWKKVKGKMSLHVYCHISGDHFLLDWFAWLRYFIFCKELPVVLNAFVHGDVDLFNNYPELQEALVWVYFHSNIPEFNKAECWGPVKEAAAPTSGGGGVGGVQVDKMPEPCQEDCSCCFPPLSLIQWPAKLPHENEESFGAQQQQQSFQQHTR